MLRASIAGHLCVDLVPQLPPSARLAPGQLIEVGPMDVRLGGCVANTGFALRDLGAEVELQAMVGDDALVPIVSRLLGDRARVTQLAGESTSFSIVLEPGGADRTFWHHTGVNARFDPRRIEIHTDLLHLGYPPLLPGTLVDDAAPLCELLGAAQRVGVTTSVDLAVVDPDSDVGRLDWRRLLSAILSVTDVISPSVDDLRSMLSITDAADLGLAEELADYLIGDGAAVALVTAGAAGMVLRSADHGRVAGGGRVLGALGPVWDDAVVRIPANLDAVPVTSTGAGDAASAGLLFALLAGFEPMQAALLARATSNAVMAGRRPMWDVVSAEEPALAGLVPS